jgi:hypothetical protein
MPAHMHSTTSFFNTIFQTNNQLRSSDFGSKKKVAERFGNVGHAHGSRSVAEGSEVYMDVDSGNSDGETSVTNVAGDNIEDDIDVDDDGRGNSSDIKVIKDSITNLLRANGGTWASEAKFPWKDMAPRLATCGLVLVNWPEDVPLPGTEQGAARKSKGISALTHHQQKTLVAAIRDSENPLRFEKANKSGMYHEGIRTTHTNTMTSLDLSNNRQPVIIGVKPSAKSKHSAPRRLFADWHVDRNNCLDRSPPAQSSGAKASKSSTEKKSSSNVPTVKAEEISSDISSGRQTRSKASNTKTTTTKANATGKRVSKKPSPPSDVDESDDETQPLYRSDSSEEETRKVSKKRKSKSRGRSRPVKRRVVSAEVVEDDDDDDDDNDITVNTTSKPSTKGKQKAVKFVEDDNKTPRMSF